VVASEKYDVFGVFQFVAKQELDGLNRVIASVDKIPNKNVARARQFPSDFEKLQDIKELAMDIPADGDGCLRFLDVALLEEQLFDSVAESSYGLLLQILAGFELSYPSIDLHFQIFNIKKHRNIPIPQNCQQSGLWGGYWIPVPICKLLRNVKNMIF